MADGEGAKTRSRQPSLTAKVRRVCAREGLLSGSGRVLVMVSGGQDSVTLLELLAGRELGRMRPAYLHVLHVNHHLRGEESDADEALVRAHCARLGLELTVAHLSVGKTGGNVQERAREARRAEAVATAARAACDRIALGHTADDQVETLLYRIGRYGGLAALRSMPAMDLPWIRPLLEVRREETSAFCRARGLAYAVDRGNAYPGYARTGIREQVLPTWESVLPGAVQGALRTAEVAAEAESVLEEVLAATGIDRAACGLDVPAVMALSPAVRRLALRAWLEGREGFAVTRAAVLTVEELLQGRGSARRDLGGGWCAIREYDLLRVEPRWSSERSYEAVRRPEGTSSARSPMSLPVPGEVEWGSVVVRAEPVAHFFAPDPGREAYLDARAVVDPLVVRGPLPGDRFRPLGAPGVRKLQDVLTDAHVPVAQRHRVPLVVSDGDIVWVGGVAVAEHGRIARDTTGMVWLSLRARGSGST
jgi:tRNA(Ile)-lysidine synthase